MSIFDRESLQGSSLADLHAIASELSIDGYRRLRKAQLIDVVTAVAESEVAIDTLVSVRDKVISAYEEIMKMPI